MAKESSLTTITSCAESRKSGEEESGLASGIFLLAVGNCTELNGSKLMRYKRDKGGEE